jgi:electron transfer flavoprotein beta subunit
MDIVVCIKQAIDVAELKTDPETNKPIIKGTPRKISDFDKNALEEAIKIKEKLGGTIRVITAGPSTAQESIREALAMGADEGYILNDPLFENLDTYGVSTVLAAAIKKLGNYDLILCGEASIDSFSAQVGPRVAELLDIPQVTYARKINAEAEKITVERDLGEMLVEVETKYPALITVIKEINEPRLPNLMQILAASSKKIEEWNASALELTASDLKIEDSNLVSVADVRALTMERKNIIIDGEIPEIAEKLASELIKNSILGGGR